MTLDLESILDRKRHISSQDGFEPTYMPSRLFPFQRSLTEWAIVTGRSGCFADCGLGKSGIEAVCAENFARHCDRPVLVLTPPSVGPQWIEEAALFGVEAKISRDGSVHRITVANWTMIHKFNPSDFCAIVGDESSILKSFDGSVKSAVTDFVKKVRYRLLATATAAPNDYTELGTHSEALGYLGYMDMLNRFFVNDQNNSATRRMYGEAPKWRFRGHSEIPFWQYICSWARAIRKPSDMGFDDAGFVLPSLSVTEHLVHSDTAPEGCLFATPATRLPEQRAEKRRTLNERCERAAELVRGTGKPYVMWCQFNDEGDFLEKLCPDALQVSGKDEDARTEKFEAFRKGKSRGLITKARIGGWGLNWQHCAHVVYFPSHSYEEYYQAVRRCYRFGQRNPVQVDLPLTEGERLIMANLKQKSVAADIMFTRLVAMMTDSIRAGDRKAHDLPMELPSWF